MIISFNFHKHYKVDVFNGVSLSLSAPLAMPTDLFGFSIAQIDADHFMVVGGGHAAWQPQNDETFIYSRATGGENHR